MALWNYTSNSPIETFQGVNTLTNGLFGTSIVVIIWLTIFFRQSQEPNRERILAANFVSGFIAILFSFFGMINEFVLGVTIVVLIGSIAMLFNRPSQ